MTPLKYIHQGDAFRELATICQKAEETKTSDTGASAIKSREALAWLVKTVYNLLDIRIPERASLLELVDGGPFREFVGNDRAIAAANYVRKLGGIALHGGKVTKKEAAFSLDNLEKILGAVLNKMGLHVEDEVHEPALPDAAASHPSGDISEAETRRMYIDMMLREAGWDVLETEGEIQPLKACIEIEVEGMPNEHNVGYVDYVLFGSNGKPLALVEAKRTSKSPSVGKNQAKLYADCLEAKYGVRPVIYCSNGFKTEVFDGAGYPYRTIFGFHSAADLELIIQRRGIAPLQELAIKDSITNRDYQKMAVRRVCEHFNTKHRKALIVMATGTGKTRTAISLCEVLLRKNWVKNILFLADRSALVRQAHKNFEKLLPGESKTVLSDDKQNADKNARIMFSTYQTMINYIDTDSKEFSVGRFDLVIIDEAHRSVYDKYTAIFDYFDSLLVGLTATPREDVDKNTYDLFLLEGGEPNFTYEFGEAVDDGYLVPYKGIKCASKIMREGIKYDSLSPAEKKEFESIWKYEKARKALSPDDEYFRDIDSHEIFEYLFNTDTVDKVLQELMEKGQKVCSGDKLGKSIIFAANHKHAELIVERFNILYPELGGQGFCSLVDNYVTYAQNLIDTFECRDKMPQIAVSVDMLDTGIDVLDILNLVFFKVIKSKIKFLQMIGRGTRLSENIFGAGLDKEFFYIFDWCKNFEFFEANPNGIEPKPIMSLTERLFRIKCDLIEALQAYEYQSDPFAKALYDKTKEELFAQVAALDITHISVRQRIEIVAKFRDKASWTYLSPVDVLDLKEGIGPILVKTAEDEAARKFDLLILQIEMSKLCKEVSGKKSTVKVLKIAEILQGLGSIPQVMAKMPTIQEISSPAFFESADLPALERVREELRDVIQFIQSETGKTFNINIEDIVETGGDGDFVIPAMTYKQKVLEFLTQNRNHHVLQKIHNLEKISAADISELENIFWKELGTKEDYCAYVVTKHLNCPDSVATLIRATIGVDRTKARDMFTQYISSNELTADQEEYLKTIVSYVCQNGDITRETLVNDAPFDEFDWQSVFGSRLTYIPQYINQIHSAIYA